MCTLLINLLQYFIATKVLSRFIFVIICRKNCLYLFNFFLFHLHHIIAIQLPIRPAIILWFDLYIKKGMIQTRNLFWCYSFPHRDKLMFFQSELVYVHEIALSNEILCCIRLSRFIILYINHNNRVYVCMTNAMPHKS